MSELTQSKERFEAMAQGAWSRADALAAVRALRAGEADSALAVAAVALHVAAVDPGRLVEIYDALCEGWTGVAPNAPAVAADTPATAIERAVLDAVWALALDPDAGRDPADITVRTAAITGEFPEAFQRALAVSARAYPGVELAASAGMPRRFTLEELAACPAGSLGSRLHSLVVDKGFDLEVLDRDSLGLAELPEPLGYLNVRILQCHDAWHEVAGYETTGLHEVAISGFQMGQFGHHYSSLFLAIVLTKVALSESAEAVGFLLDTILSAYRHGRETPPLLPVVWEDVWALPMDELRARLGVTPYDSPYPAGLLETLRAS
jgi:ubiquinone biosynthesis protein Coq4